MMFERLAPLSASSWRLILLLLSVQISTVSIFRYFTTLEPPPAPVAANAFADPFLPLHVAASIVALLSAPIQLLGRVRARWPGFHRATGRVYVIACAIGAPTGFILALGTTAGIAAGTGFAIQALLWGGATWFGWRAAVERRFDDHRAWMLRSYALTASAITLRIMLPASMFAGIDFFQAYPVIAWLDWIVNLALVEYYIRRKRDVEAKRVALAAV